MKVTHSTENQRETTTTKALSRTEGKALRLTSYFCSKTKQETQNALPCLKPPNLILLPCPAQHCLIVISLHRDQWNSNCCELIYIRSVTTFCEWHRRISPLCSGNSKHYLTFLDGNHVLDIQQDSELGKTSGRVASTLCCTLAGWAAALLQKHRVFLQHSRAQQPELLESSVRLWSRLLQPAAGQHEQWGAKCARPELPQLPKRGGDMSWETLRCL